METATKDNVLPLQGKFGLFPPLLRSRLESSVAQHTTNPAGAVGAVELVICLFIVDVARRAAITLGKRLAERLTSK